ncbi:hypothetical protein OROMI_024668 [Orobanche minor]
MDIIQAQNEDLENMNLFVSRIRQQGLYRLGGQFSDLYDERIVEEFFLEASFKLKSGGDVSEISGVVRGIEVRVDKETLKSMFRLPSNGLKMEELESFGSDDLLTVYWRLFTGDSADTNVHPSCHKKRFCLPFVYLHDFCCRVIENRTGAFEMCTNLRMMVAIMSGELVNWCQIVLKMIQEEAAKPSSHRKSFGLILNNILTLGGVPQSSDAKKIGQGKLIGGSKPTYFNKDIPVGNRPSLKDLPLSDNPRDITIKSKSEEKSKKRSVSDRKSPLVENPKKKLRKAHKPKPTGIPVIPINAQNADVAPAKSLSTTAEETATVRGIDPEPLAAMTDDLLFAKLEGTGESADHIELTATSPIRDPIPEQDPSPTRVPTPYLDQAVERFTQWKEYRVAPFETLYHWSDWKAEEDFVLEVTNSQEIPALIKWDNQFCKELISNHFMEYEKARLKGKSKFVDSATYSPKSDHDSDDDDEAFQAGLRIRRGDI